MKVNCKSLYPSKSGIEIDENLNWKQQIHDIVIKLNRANALLLTIRNPFKGNAQFVQKVTFEPLMDFKQSHYDIIEVGNITKAATFKSFFFT